MDPYLARIANMPALSAERESLLAHLTRDGDRVARDELITSMLGLVVARARHLGFKGARLMDAVQSGSEGLIRAVDRFDPDRGTRLASYAWWWIAHAMKTDDRETPINDFEINVDAIEPDPHFALRAVLGGLDALEAKVVALRFGCGSVNAVRCTRSETAAATGLTVGQVRRVEDKAIGHLRGRLAKVGARAPDERNLEGAGPL